MAKAKQAFPKTAAEFDALDEPEFEEMMARLRRRKTTEEHKWRFWARDEQVAPRGDWRVWLIRAGRGFGKSRAGAEWVRSVAEGDGRARIANVGATMQEIRHVMVEGPSGLLSIAPSRDRPVFEPSLRKLSWKNGAEAMLYSAAEPETLRGPEHSHAWCDELAKWPRGEAVWDMLGMTMRAGELPRIVATTTPRVRMPAGSQCHCLGLQVSVRCAVMPTPDNRGNYFAGRCQLAGPPRRVRHCVFS